MFHFSLDGDQGHKSKSQNKSSFQEGDKIITNFDSSVYYKVQWIDHTHCDSFFITKCDTAYYKLLTQVLQRVLIITAEEKSVST